jgi:hypothetical protein
VGVNIEEETNVAVNRFPKILANRRDNELLIAIHLFLMNCCEEGTVGIVKQ